ncbi:hypothetical protein BV22DRAFT_1199571 [Leucogyrophana mollusca]|uniref:Uncharacterized protein n=1 Tax=Leucogyrophana mollusca TaxID=85980 RepID=A0ACB8B2C6_9AGAM|nr:hypothetical protein BV22DRAFT_1199571 [Leucogyrophana mollusca]
MRAFTVLTALVAASVATVHALPTGTRGDTDNGRDVVARGTIRSHQCSFDVTEAVVEVPGEDASRAADSKNSRGLFRFRRARRDQTVKTESSRSILRSMIPSRRRRDARDEQGVYQRGNAKSVESVITTNSYSSNGQDEVIPTLRRESVESVSTIRSSAPSGQDGIMQLVKGRESTESVASGNSGYSHAGRAGVKQLVKGRKRTESVASGNSNYSHEGRAGVTQLIKGRESTESVASGSSNYSHEGQAGVTQLIKGRESTESVATSSYSHAG